MKRNFNNLLFLLTVVLIGCQKEIIFEYQNTEILIQYSDDVSPCRAFLTPEHIGQVQTWEINEKIIATEFVNDSCTMELIVEPSSEIHLHYETTINNIIYTFDDVIESPPLANKLTIYGINFFNESDIVEDNNLFFRYDYDFHYATEYSSGVMSDGGGRQLIYTEGSSLSDLFSPIEVQLTPVFGDKKTPHIFYFDIINYSDTIYIVSSMELQDLYFNFRFNYENASIDNPNLIIFKNQISSQEYELIVDWSNDKM